MSSIIFLDIEGVILTGCYSGRPVISSERLTGKFDPLTIYWLNRLSMETGAEIVITSTWRFAFDLDELRTKFRNSGFRGRITGHLSTNIDFPRSNHIRSWLQAHDIHRYVIIDDVVDDLKEEFPGHFVETSYHRGLTAETYLQAKQCLKQDELIPV